MTTPMSPKPCSRVFVVKQSPLFVDGWLQLLFTVCGGCPGLVQERQDLFCVLPAGRDYGFAAE